MQPHALREASGLVKGRRRAISTGGLSVRALLKFNVASRYCFRSAKSIPQVPLRAALIDEPSYEQTVDMLQALPPGEAMYYSCGHHAIDKVGKAHGVILELRGQFGFVGGPLQEYQNCFLRGGLPSSMWAWATGDIVEAVAGLSVVAK